MSTNTIKEQVLKRLEGIEDEQVLQGILNFMEVETNPGETIHVSDKLANRIEKSRKQIAEGKSYTHNEVKNKVDEWLKQ